MGQFFVFHQAKHEVERRTRQIFALCGVHLVDAVDGFLIVQRLLQRGGRVGIDFVKFGLFFRHIGHLISRFYGGFVLGLFFLAGQRQIDQPGRLVDQLISLAGGLDECIHIVTRHIAGARGGAGDGFSQVTQAKRVRLVAGGHGQSQQGCCNFCFFHDVPWFATWFEKDFLRFV